MSPSLFLFYLNPLLYRLGLFWFPKTEQVVYQSIIVSGWSGLRLTTRSSYYWPFHLYCRSYFFMNSLVLSFMLPMLLFMFLLYCLPFPNLRLLILHFSTLYLHTHNLLLNVIVLQILEILSLSRSSRYTS